MSKEVSSPNEKPKRRQRMSLVCLNCRARKIKCDKKRPSCTNCVKCNVGHLCKYEAPSWVQKVTTSDGVPIIAAVEMKKEQELNNDLDSDHTPTIEELQDEIKRLRSMLDEKHGALETSHTYSDGLNQVNGETVNLYNSFNGLTVKRSGMEERKPLSVSSHEIKDQYYMIMVGYFNICSKFYKTKMAVDEEKAATKGKQKKRLDASVSEFLCLLNERESPEMLMVIQRFIEQRLPLNDGSMNGLLITGFDYSKKKSDEAELKSKIEPLLPNKAILKLYLERFYNSVYPFYPFINRDFFNDRLMNSILQSADDLSPITLKIDEKFDFVMLATLLVILRLTYVSLPKPQLRSEEDKVLAAYPVKPDVVSVALSVLSSFKFLRKTKLTFIQVLLYLRVYFIYAPEDGDGTDLSQSQILFGIIVQSAYMIGLNRDPSNYIQMSHDVHYANVWRKLWYGILEIDKSISTLSGFLCLVQNNHSYNAQIPQPVADDPPVESVISEELRKSQKILNCYSDLANLLNDKICPPRLDQILEHLREMNTCVGLMYPIRNLAVIQGDAEEVLRISLTNVKKLQHNLQAKSFTLTTYQDLYLYYEAGDPIDFRKTKHYQNLTLKAAIDLSNVIYSYFREDIYLHIHPNHLYFLNRYIQNAAQRVFNSLASMLTRLYQATDLVRRGDVQDDTAPGLEILVSLTFRAAFGLNLLIMNNLGTRHYQAFKSSLKNKFFLRTLKKDGFKGISDTISYFNEKMPTDPNTMIRLLQRVNLKSSPQSILGKLEAMNCFVHLSQNEVETLQSLLTDCSILKDAALSSEDLIWEPSFKNHPEVFTRESSAQPCSTDARVLETPSTITGLQNGTGQAPASFIDINQIFANDSFVNDYYGNIDADNFDDLFKL